MPTTPRAFAAPADLSPNMLAWAESVWASISWAGDIAEDGLAFLLDLGPGDGHDELTRCEAPGCDAWHWADEGGTVVYESGARMQMCAVHAVPDDPGARVYPGVGLEAAWGDAEQAAISERIRATGRPW